MLCIVKGTPPPHVVVNVQRTCVLHLLTHGLVVALSLAHHLCHICCAWCALGLPFEGGLVWDERFGYWPKSSAPGKHSLTDDTYCHGPLLHHPHTTIYPTPLYCLACRSLARHFLSMCEHTSLDRAQSISYCPTLYGLPMREGTAWPSAIYHCRLWPSAPELT